MSDIEEPGPEDLPIHEPIPVAPLPPSDILDQVVERASEKMAGVGIVPQRNTSLMVQNGLLIAVIILIGALFVVRAGDQRQIRRAIQVIYAGNGCLLADLDDHRHTNQFAHNKLVEEHHFPPIIQPDVIPLTPDQAARLKALCSEFIKSGRVSLQHLGEPMERPGQAEGGTDEAPAETDGGGRGGPRVVSHASLR